MPPWSDVRTLAQSLGTGDDFVTFLDVLPLQRLAQSLIHMTRPTLEAIAELHDGAHVTLGAKDVLKDVLRSYYSRARLERQLGQKPLTVKEHNKTIRLPQGQHSSLMLPKDQGHFWLVQTRALGGSLGAVALEEVEGRQKHAQHMVLRALTPGIVEVTGQLQQSAVPSRPLLPGATHHGPQRARPKRVEQFCVVVIVEEMGDGP